MRQVYKSLLIGRLLSFVGFADFLDIMNEEKLIEAAHHLAESREQFVKELRLAMEGFMAFSDRLRTFGEYLDARDSKINAGMEINASVHESLARLVELLKENTIALNENTERLDRSLTKFETYFGTLSDLLLCKPRTSHSRIEKRIAQIAGLTTVCRTR